MRKIAIVLSRLENSFSLPSGAEDSEILRFIEECQINLRSAPPFEYLDFLRLHNGFAGNGLFLYSTQRTPLLDCDGVNLGFVEVNLNWRDLDWMSDYLVLGDSDMDVYVFEVVSNRFQVRDRQAFDNVFEEFSKFDELLEYIANLVVE
jgi:hypothetical protein